MGLQSALSTALTGLNAAETTIDVVGNNVANSQTVGFKASNAVFATQFLQTQSLGSGPTAGSGGTNPRQIGLGTKVAEITPDFTQGTIEISANPLDLAIQGDGFLIVQGSQGEQFYTRNGQLKTNSNNELVTINGQRLLGYGIDDNFVVQETSLQALTIPFGAKQESQITQNVFLQGNLVPNSDVVSTAGIIESAILSDSSFDIPPDLATGDISTVLAPNLVGTSGAASTTGGSVGAGDYNYRITFIDADGNESPASVPIGPITVAGEDTIDLSNLPPADGVTFVARNLYRTDASGTGAYSLVTQLNSSDTTYQDTAADGSLGAVLDDTDLAQGNYSYYVTFYNSGTGAESRPTSQIGPLSVGASGQRIRLQNLPDPTTAPNGDFDQVRIYRSLSSSSSEHYLIDTLAAGVSSYIDNAADAAISTNAQANLDGPEINFGTNLVDLTRFDGTNYNDNLFVEGTLSFSAKKGDRSLATQTFQITTTTTVGDLIDFMDESLGIQTGGGIPGTPGGTVSSNSTLQFTSNLGTRNEVEIDLSSFSVMPAAGGVAQTVSLPFNVVQDAEGESTVTDFLAYDSLGSPVNVRLTTVLESIDSDSSTYRWFADSSDNAPSSGSGIAAGTGLITLDGDGNVLSVTNSNVSVDREDSPAASPLSFNLDFSNVSGKDVGASSLQVSSQDGSPPGTLASFRISESGLILGVFSNGQIRDLGQIRLARFTNNSGLEQVGDNLFATGVNSGLPVEGNPGEQGIGSITSGAVELSNTDIGQNLIELILASTQYRGGTRVITAAQQLLDELLALRR